MTAPWWASGDGDVTLWLGDCLAVLPSLPDCSVDAIVTDPPYGLEFMGREWDTFRQAPTGGAAIANVSIPGTGFKHLPNYQGRPNPTCQNCKGMKRGQDRPGFTRCRCDAPDFPNISLKQMRAFQAWCEQWAVECLRVLKPGGWLLAFGGTRTSHRLVCGIEDAGFEIRDAVADLTGIDGPGLLWLYGLGFPKSLDVSKAIDKAAGAEREVVGSHFRHGGGSEVSGSMAGPLGTASELPLTAPATPDAARWEGWGTALKPAWEPIVVARKPLAGTVAANVLEHGTGALNIDGCRVGTGDALVRPHILRTDNEVYGKGLGAGIQDEPAGRWPPNVVLGETAATELDRQSGVLTSGANPARRGSDKFRDAYGEFAGQEECTPHRGADSGGASRFFPVFRYEAKAAAHERPRLPDGTAHPTVKPVDLIAWLIRLVTPPGGTVLDPFAGSGTTAQACIVEGFRAVLIEQDPQSAELIKTRLSKPIQPTLFGGAA